MHKYSLFGVQLDDSLLINRNIDLFTVRETSYRTREVGLISLEPCRSGQSIAALFQLFEEGIALALLSNSNHVVSANECRRNVYLLAVNREMAMTNELTSLTARICEAETEHNVVQTALKKTEQVFTSYALHLLCFIVVSTELFLQYTVDKLCFLLFFQLHAILRNLTVRTTRLTFGFFGTTDNSR